MFIKITALTSALIFSLSAFANKSLSQSDRIKNLDAAIKANQWREAVQLAHEGPFEETKIAELFVKGAYALFQNEYSNAALLLLSQIKPEQWRYLPHGSDRLAEAAILLQKKVPMNLLPSRIDQISMTDSVSILREEIQFAKGRAAFENHQDDEAKVHLSSITSKSRFYAQSRYILGTLAVRNGDNNTAAKEFSKVFDSSVFEQSTEIWKNLSSEMTSHLYEIVGANLKIELDGDLVAENKKVGELATLGLARIAYADQDFKLALEYYLKISNESEFHAQAVLEKIWTLLALNRHQEAQQCALSLTASESSFESLEARTLRALILTDAGQVKEANEQLNNFLIFYQNSKKLLVDYETTADKSVLPDFLKTDLRNDKRIEQLIRYQNNLQNEITALRAEDSHVFPVFSGLANKLEPILLQAKKLNKALIEEHIAQRKKALDRLYLQARLIRIETFLEEREKLRSEFQNSSDLSSDLQMSHDIKLAELLQKAVDEIDEINKDLVLSDPQLEFRQSELLWELSGVTSIIAQLNNDKKMDQRGDTLKKRSLYLAQNVVKNYPYFEKHGRALFFVGFALSEMNQIESGLKILREFVKKYPAHVHTPDAYRILADERFDANDFRAAEAYYKKVLHFKDSAIVGYSLYKIGWCAYNRKDFSRTLLGLEKAFIWAKRASSEVSTLTLEREAQADLITMFAEFGDYRKAREYFSQFLQEDSGPWLVTLAYQLDRMGQFEKSGALYRLLIAANIDVKQNAVFQARVIYGLYFLRRWPEVVEAATELLNNYKASLVIPQDEDSIAGQTEKILRDAVLAQLFEFRKQSVPEAVIRVSKLNQIYLTLFSDWPSSQEPLYLHAHFLLEQDQEIEAAIFFEKHWSSFNPVLKEPIREESLRNLVFSLNQVENKNPASDMISNSAKAAIRYAHEYEKQYPQTKHTRTISFLRPAFYFKYKESTKAIQEAQQLFDVNPADQVGQLCFKNLRNAYYENKNWESTYRWSSELLSRKNPLLKSYQDDLKTIQEESLFLWADSTADDLKASDLFLKLVRDDSMKKLKDKSLYNAFIRTNKAGKKLKALALADELEQRVPEYEGLSEVRGLRAAMFQEAGDYIRSSVLIEQFLKAPPPEISKETLLQARLNAGLMAEALENSKTAQEHFNIYLKTQNDGTGAIEARRSLVRMNPLHLISPSSRWRQLLNLSTTFAKKTIPKNNDVGVAIKNSSLLMEKQVKSLLEFSSDKETATSEALEAFCQVALLYDIYSKALMDLADIKGLSEIERKDLQTELKKIADPIEQKGKDIALQCLSKSIETEHNGEIFQTVMMRWGWASDLVQKEKMNYITQKLSDGYPWLETVKLNLSELDILNLHHELGGSEDSWYALSMIRLKSGRKALARLTLVDALGKYPNSGKILNVLGILAIEGQKKDQENSITQIFEKAGLTGASKAWANLALHHLSGLRLSAGIKALRQCLESGVFHGDPELIALVRDFIKQ